MSNGRINQENKKQHTFKHRSRRISYFYFKRKIVPKESILICQGDTVNEIFRIKSKGPKVYTKQQLLKIGYPEPNQDYYLVIEF